MYTAKGMLRMEKKRGGGEKKRAVECELPAGTCYMISGSCYMISGRHVLHDLRLHDQRTRAAQKCFWYQKKCARAL